MVGNKKYSFSFTGGSLLLVETSIIAEEYIRLKDWNKVKHLLHKHNPTNKVKSSTFQRQFTEIRKRIDVLTPSQLTLVIDGNREDAKAIILLSIAKTYSFIKDFIIEVVRTKYMQFDIILSAVDYTKFCRSKANGHPELIELSESTSKKVKQRTFTVLHQGGLITKIKNGTIVKPVLSENVINVIIDENPVFLAVFLFSNEEIKRVSHKLKHA